MPASAKQLSAIARPPPTLLLLLLLLLLVAAAAAATAPPPPTERPLCRPGAPTPPNRFNSTDRLRRLRQLLRLNETSFYLQTDRDRFLSGPQPQDEFRWWLSGFAGSAGNVLISGDRALLFTDSRYTVQADSELDCHWLLYDGLRFADWLRQQERQRPWQLQLDTSQISSRQFGDLHKLPNLVVSALASNPVAELWTSGRPAPARQEVYPLGRKYTGQAWQAKVRRTREAARAAGADWLAVTSLDDTAYLLNLRATVVAYKPYFPSLVLLAAGAGATDSLFVFVDDPGAWRANQTLRAHFADCADACPSFRNFSELVHVASSISGNRSLTVAVDFGATSAAVVGGLLAAGFKTVDKVSPIRGFKSVKNSAEQSAFADCSLADSAALVGFLKDAEDRVGRGERLTELTAAALLRRHRAKLADFRGLSFETISAVGANAAVVHYRPSAATDAAITRDRVFLLDSGGQYLGCTTDVTRTMYYGSKPHAAVRAAYTRVLAGVIDLFNTTWPAAVQSSRLDAFARHNLWALGQDYGHGTGHGIGLFLGVHEGPNGIGRAVALQIGNFQSIEPGYYQRETPQAAGFGIRLETITGVRRAPGIGADFLQFLPVTWVPFEPKLIDTAALTARQTAWLNWYHAECRRRLLPELRRIGQGGAADWVVSRTQPILPAAAAAAAAGVWLPAAAAAAVAAATALLR